MNAPTALFRATYDITLWIVPIFPYFVGRRRGWCGWTLSDEFELVGVTCGTLSLEESGCWRVVSRAARRCWAMLPIDGQGWWLGVCGRFGCPGNVDRIGWNGAESEGVVLDLMAWRRRHQGAILPRRSLDSGRLSRDFGCVRFCWVRWSHGSSGVRVKGPVKGSFRKAEPVRCVSV